MIPTDQCLTRHEKERARKRTKRARESSVERNRRKQSNRDRNQRHRSSESKAERLQRLAADQQRKADRRASESEAQREQHLAAGQQREANRRASESEAQHEQRLAAGQQREANRRASESEVQRDQRLSSNRERITAYRSNMSVEERQQIRETDRINASRRRSAARQSVHDQQRGGAVSQFRQSICTGPVNPCYCCTRLCYNNGGSFIDANDPLLLPIHNRELSNIIYDGEYSVWICSRCKRSLRRHKLPSFASVNNMSVPPVPPELSCLNSMEKRLICKVQPFMKLVVLPYGQRALQGQTVNFPVNTSEICSSLPKTLDNAGIVLIAPARTGSSDSTETPVAQTCFSVRRPYVVRALRWLKHHNTLYRDIEIEEIMDDASSSQVTVNEIILDDAGESSVIRRDLQVPNIEISNVVNNSNAPIHQLQRVQGAPISIYTCRDAEQMAFPWLFPDGTNGYKTSRDPPITTLDYFQTRLLSSDTRWASHIPYLFWCCNVIEQRRLNENISVAIRMRSFRGNARTNSPAVCRQSSDSTSHDCLTAGDLRDMSNNPELSDSCYGFMHNMRGTIAYWQRAKHDLLAMFRTLGPPAFFITLTADDMNWLDLLYVLAKRAGMDITVEDVDNLSSEQKRELLCSDPVTTARHFSQRFQKFIGFLKGSSKPIGEVVDYFWRVEFQLRGSPHVHSLWWVKDAPDLQTVEGLRAVPGFIDNYITTKIPSEGEDDELRSLVMRLQRHKHTHTCQKNGRQRCRFDYPKQPSPETRLKTNADGGNKARFYIIKREPGAEMVNPYNQHLLHAWRANMDIQVVGSVYGAALYVTHYICKDESQVLKQAIAEQLANLQQDATVKQCLRKIGNTLLSHYQLSQQEAAFLVTGLHLKGSSRATVFVSALPKCQRTRLVRLS